MQRPPSLSEAADYPATTLLGALAAAVSIARFTGRDVERLVMDGRAFRGEPWRAVTTVLPHGDVLHLVFNLAWFWSLGTVLESRYGTARYLISFVFLAAVPMLAEYALAGSGIGLSGVVYGFFAWLWVLARRDPRMHGAVDPSTTKLMAGWFVFCIVATQLGLLHVANITHGAGALLGALIGYAATSRGVRRAGFILGIAAICAAILVGAAASRSW